MPPNPWKQEGQGRRAWHMETRRREEKKEEVETRDRDIRPWTSTTIFLSHQRAHDMVKHLKGRLPYAMVLFLGRLPNSVKVYTTASTHTRALSTVYSRYISHSGIHQPIQEKEHNRVAAFRHNISHR